MPQCGVFLFSFEHALDAGNNAVGINAVFLQQLVVGSGLGECVLNADKLGRSTSAEIRQHLGNSRAEAAVDIMLLGAHYGARFLGALFDELFVDGLY